MDKPGVRQVPEGSGEQGKMEKTGCKIICGAPTTLIDDDDDDDDDDEGKEQEPPDRGHHKSTRQKRNLNPQFRSPN